MKKITRIALTLLIITTISDTPAYASSTDSDSIANLLGWKKDKKPGAECNLCDGHYAEPIALSSVPVPPNYKTTLVTVTAKGPVTFRPNGDSVLRDDVLITQPGRIIHADKAIIHRDGHLGIITDIQLMGHVSVQEDGKILLGEKAEYNVQKNYFKMNDGIYRISGEYQLLTMSTPFNAWGTASSVKQKPNGEIDLTNATYSTCPPKNPSWQLSAKSMQLDRAKGEGYAHDLVIRFKNVPIFYTPYYSFPMSNARKSGFLTPSVGYQNGTGQQGSYISLPYYWNMAPNYDALITPTWYLQRGLQLNGLFRYLTPDSDGALYASFLPDDREFATFKNNALNTVANYSSPNAAPYFTELENSSNNRTYIDFTNNFKFNDQWSGKLNARYISDSYYEENFQSTYLTQNTNQVPSFAELNYQGVHWKDIVLLQTYQTLHPLDQYTTAVQNQYSRLPEMDFGAAYPEFADGFDFNLSGQAVNFVYQSDFTPLTYQLPIGGRYHLAPSISRPFTWSSFYITPEVTADSTAYTSELAATTSTTPRADYNADRTLPIFDIDSGLYFDRETTIGKSEYIQTLQPRIFYLYTPYLDQDGYPNFDTVLLPFSTAYLYALNEFSGFDRLQNANQLTLGLTSNLLSAEDARNILSAQVGVIDYFSKPSVCLNPNCITASQSLSPITGSLTWNPNSMWSINSQAAWDTNLAQVNNAQAGAEYHFLNDHIFLLSYQFTHGSSDIPYTAQNYSPNSSLITVGLVWPITRKWNFLGYSYYDITHGHIQNQYVGFSYNTCCWALRFIMSNDYNGNNTINGSGTFQNSFTTNYFLEFSLKGLGSTGYGSAENMLTSTLPGFSDVFSNNGNFKYNENI